MQVIYSPEGQTGSAFSGYLSEEQLLSGIAQPTDARESALHSCVKEICKDFDPDKTLRAYTEAIGSRANDSDFFDKEILPVLLEQREQALEGIAEAEVFIDAAAKPLANFPVNDSAVELYQFFQLMNEINELQMHPNIILGGDIVMGTLERSTGNSPFLGNKINEEAFLEAKKSGLFPNLSLEAAKHYIERRDNSNILALGLGNIGNLVNLYGRGAKETLLRQFDSAIALRNGIFLQQPNLITVFDFPTLNSSRKFFQNNFDEYLRLMTISNPAQDMLSGLYAVLWLEQLYPSFEVFLKTAPKPDLSELQEEDIKPIIDLARQRIAQSKEYVEPQNLNETLSRQCRFKMNYIYEALPTEEEISKSKQIGTKAVLEFNQWLYGFSGETATSFFDYMRGWDFFYPLSKNEFREIVLEFLKVERKQWSFPRDPKLASVFFHSIHQGLGQVAPNYHGYHTIENFCQNLNITAVNDVAFSQLGQVRLSWMAIRDDRLLKSVIWHELGHILSAMLRDLETENFTRAVLKKKINVPVSYDSFLKFSQSRQCLGEMQEQRTSMYELGEPFMTWYRNGWLDAFKIQASDGLMERLGDPANSNFSTSEFIGGMFYSPKSELLNTEDEVDNLTKLKEKSYESLSVYKGEFSEEDWADLIAAKLGENQENHFCVVLKDRDHLFWNEEKGHVPDNHPQLMGVPEEFRKKYAEDLDKHSTTFFRLLHTETVRSGVLPPSCQRAKQLEPSLSQIKKCDYF